MTNPGDSGCVIVRDTDNAVTGLHFGHSDDGQESYSNPLYRIGWVRLAGNYPVPPDPENNEGASWLPQFTAVAVPDRCC
jgi:hypothetical protein